MARSLKKGPFADAHLVKRLNNQIHKEVRTYGSLT